MKRIIFTLLLLTMIFVSKSQNYFVSKKGNDSNNGSYTSPFLTIQAALNKASRPGDSVLVRTGTYFENLSFPHSGSVNEPIVVASYKDEIVRIDASRISPAQAIFVKIEGQNHLIIRGFCFQNFRNRKVASMGLAVIGPSDGVQLLANKFMDFNPKDTKWGGLKGIAVFSTSNQHVSNFRITGNKFIRIATGESEVVSLNGFIHDFEVSDNEVFDAATNPILQVGGGYKIKDWVKGYDTDSLGVPSRAVFRNNYIHDNRKGHGTIGIYIDGGQDIIIENNRIINNVVGIGIGCEEIRAKKSRNIIIRNNVLINNSNAIWNGNSPTAIPNRPPGAVDSIFIYNNTLVNGEGGLLRFEKSPASNIFVYNNIFWQKREQAGGPMINADNPAIPNFVLNYNLYYSGSASSPNVFFYGGKSYNTLSKFQSATGNEANGRWADPLFEGLPFNVELKNESPAIDAGVVLDKVPTDIKGVRRPSGSGTDIGAYEKNQAQK
jgi:hypothetical protein